jgi:hypothetical protein
LPYPSQNWRVSLLELFSELDCQFKAELLVGEQFSGELRHYSFRFFELGVLGLSPTLTGDLTQKQVEEDVLARLLLREGSHANRCLYGHWLG